MEITEYNNINMLDIILIINELRQLSGNVQLDYLQEHKSELLKEILDYTYNPHKMFKIDESKYDKIKVYKGLIPRVKKQNFTLQDWHKFIEMLDILVEKRAVTDMEVKNVKLFITDFMDENIQSFLSMVLFKDLRLNIGIKKIQTVWPDFCNEPELQLAENYCGIEFVNGLYSRKFDGKRMYIMDGIAYSRSNKPCKVAPIQHILEQLKEVSVDTVFDGELLYFDNEGNEDFQKGISLTASDERTKDCDNLYYVIFDSMNISDFKRKKTEIEFRFIYDIMLNMLEAKDSKQFGYSVLDTKYPNILIARQGSNIEKLKYFCDLYSWEGLMYRNADAPYQFKRTKEILKMKSMKDAEFSIVDLQEGTGKNKERLGTIFIKYKNSNVGVGSGFSDTDRELIWNNKEIFLNEQFKKLFNIKVQYFEETQNAEGEPSLRFPVFLCFRDIVTGEEFGVEEILKLRRGNEK